MTMKYFPRSVVWSVVCGRVLCRDGFSPIRECIDHMAGVSVWTHQIPDWKRRSKEKLDAMFPEFVKKPDIEENGFDQWRERTGPFWLDEPISVDLGCIGECNGDPMEDLPDGKEIIVSNVGKP